MLVALTALKEGHEATLFLASDGVHLLAPDHRGIEGQGTGKLADHLSALAELGAPIFLSGMSAKARGYDDSLLAGQKAEFAMPTKLVALAAEADNTLCY
jgi:predicted peroxiredoxin